MIDIGELDNLIRKFDNASRNLRPFMGEVLEDIGDEFLDIVQEEIMRAKNVDTRLLLSSFSRGSEYNVYELDLGGLTLEIGTRVKYAKWVNDGHRQQPGRFVPGIWRGDRFQYVPGAKTGMVLKASFVAGSHFFDKSVEVLKRMFPEMAEAKFQQFISRYF